MPEPMFNAPEGGVASPGAARDELGAPRIVTGAEAADAMGRLGYNVENMTSMLPTMNKIVDSTTSLIDNAYQRQLNLRKSVADLGEAAAKTKLYGAQSDNIQSESDLRKATMHTEVQKQKVGLQQAQLQLQQAQLQLKAGQIGLTDTQRQQQIADVAYNEYPAYRDAMAALSPDDPDLDNKVAAIKRQYSNASTFGATEARVSGYEQDLYNRRKNSTTFQYNSAMMAGLEKLQEQGHINARDDVRARVLAGDGPVMLQDANKDIVNKRLDSLAAAATNPVDAQWVQQERRAINNPSQEQGAIFGHDGSLNAGDDARISQMERKYNLAPQYPGAKMTITQELDKDTGKMVTKREITGVAPTLADILTAEGVGAGKGGEAYDFSKDAEYQQALKNFNSDPKFRGLQGDAANTAFLQELHRLKEAANQTGANAKPAPGTTPTLPVQPQRQERTGATGRHKLSEADQGNAEVRTVSYNPDQEGGAASRLPTSNNDYRFPDEAPDVLGINRNVWANVMSEEGQGFGKDGSHDSVFGLWADAGDVEGEAYDVVRRYGANSPEAFNAVTAAWTDKFLKQSQPWQLSSPGLQELVIADSQHRGGAKARDIIDQMGGYATVNNMNPTEAIDEYSRLRAGLWPGNMGRVIRERDWALKNDGVLRGQGGQERTMTAEANAPAPPAAAAQPTQPQLAGARASATRPALTPVNVIMPGQTERPAEVAAQYLPRPTTVAEARALPSGSHFIDPEGNRRMVA